MAVNTRSNSGKDGVFLSFVPLLGGLFVDNEDTRAAIKEARVYAGAKQTDGYQGYKGGTVSAKALAFLKEKGVFSASSVSGVLRGVSYDEKEHQGNLMRRVFVTLRDDGQSFTIKLDAGNPGTHKLLQKLSNVSLNEHVDISVFGSYKPNPKNPDGEFYTDYAASVKIAGIEVKVEEGAWDAVNAVVKGVQEQMALIPGMSKEVVGTAVRTAKTNFFAELAKKIGAEFKSARDAEKAAGGIAHDEPAASSEDEYIMQTFRNDDEEFF